MQSSLPQDLVPIGASTLLAIISTSCAVFMTIGNAVFESQLRSNLTHIVPRPIVDRLISAGATNINTVVTATELPAVILQYSKSITRIFVSLLFTFSYPLLF